MMIIKSSKRKEIKPMGKKKSESKIPELLISALADLIIGILLLLLDRLIQ